VARSADIDAGVTLVTPFLAIYHHRLFSNTTCWLKYNITVWKLKRHRKNSGVTGEKTHAERGVYPTT
jgi:hypothetical protein